MKRNLFILSLFALSVCTQAQTYVWKNGHPLVEDPDSLTFVKPDLGAQVADSLDGSFYGINYRTYKFTYLTTDHNGLPIWMSAGLHLTPAQIASKHIGKMAMYNHYTIASSSECPTNGLFDLQVAAMAAGLAVVSADYEGFGETGERVQAYCFGEENARASIDALLAAREWLLKQGYSLTDSLINYGYSQGGQTTIAAIKLSQGEYRGRVHFMKSYAGAGPYSLRLTYQKFLEWGKIGQAAVLPLTIITFNELCHLGLNYADVFTGKLATNVKSWILSKKYNTDELQELFGSNLLVDYMQPAYLDETTEGIQVVLQAVDQKDLTTGWEPDIDTDITLMHSRNDDIVACENTQALYDFFMSKGLTNVKLDLETLNDLHTASGTTFALYLAANLASWK